MAMANVYVFLGKPLPCHIFSISGELQGPQIPIEGGVRGRIGDALHQRTVLTFSTKKHGVETVENGKGLDVLRKHGLKIISNIWGLSMNIFFKY
jgi:hypothetical protein